MFEFVLFSIKFISISCTVVFNVSKVNEIRYLAKYLKAYPVNKCELIHFSDKIICNAYTVVFNVSKVHEIRCLKVLRHLRTTSDSSFSDLI